MSISAKVLSKVHNMAPCELVDICFQMAEAHPESFKKFLGVVEFVEIEIPNSVNEKITLTPEQDAELRAHVQMENPLIPMIKKVRGWTNMSLRQAKDLIEVHYLGN